MRRYAWKEFVYSIEIFFISVLVLCLSLVTFEYYIISIHETWYRALYSVMPIPDTLVWLVSLAFGILFSAILSRMHKMVRRPMYKSATTEQTTTEGGTNPKITKIKTLTIYERIAIARDSICLVADQTARITLLYVTIPLLAIRGILALI
ncbi:MAG: hypothetical protein Q8P30_02425 [Candidatus Uhrbacteria bacterium]|nr:hypothetical protein [Candidatus Uhrbacteria bacterium]